MSAPRHDSVKHICTRSSFHKPGGMTSHWMKPYIGLWAFQNWWNHTSTATKSLWNLQSPEQRTQNKGSNMHHCTPNHDHLRQVCFGSCRLAIVVCLFNDRPCWNICNSSSYMLCSDFPNQPKRFSRLRATSYGHLRSCASLARCQSCAGKTMPSIGDKHWIQHPKYPKPKLKAPQIELILRLRSIF